MFLLTLRQTSGTVLFAYLCLAVASLGMPALATPQTESLNTTSDLDGLVANKQYPELEQALATNTAELPPQSRAYFEGILANRLNRAQESIELLEPLIPKLLINNLVRGEVALCAVADDYAKSFRYADAARIYAEANRIAKQNNIDPGCNAALESSRWSLLSNAAAQTVASSGEFTIQAQRDKIGLLQVPVTAGSYSGSWIVDSGANLSIISKSVAMQLGVEESGPGATAEGSSGISVPVHTAVVPEIHLGPAIIRNVPVLVTADADLTFPSIDYHIEGSLGLPVLAALGSITVYHNGQIKFGAANEHSKPDASSHNLFLEKFTPLIIGDFGTGNHLFTIDTGAIGTMLSAQFYRESKDVFDASDLVSLEVLGAGGSFTSPALQIRGLAAELGGDGTRLHIALLTQATGSTDEFFGNIGQDMLRAFASFTLDFRAMTASVTGGKPTDCPRR